MRRAFVLLSEFERAWRSIGLGDSELEDLQDLFLKTRRRAMSSLGLAEQGKSASPWRAGASLAVAG